MAELITNPQFDLTGVCVSTPEKVGKDAGELCGVGLDAATVTGVKAVAELDATNNAAGFRSRVSSFGFAAGAFTRNLKPET